METENNSLRPHELGQLIHSTLQDAISALSRDLDAMKASPEDYNVDQVGKLIERTRQFVVFLKYSGDYLRHILPHDPIRQEILQIKLHLLGVLRALVEAVRTNDRVSARDLLTEELRDNLTLWKIKVLPLLRPITSAPSPSGSTQA